MPYPTEHAARIKDPGQFDTIRRENDKFASGIDAIWGIKDGKSELQAIRFDKTKYTVAQAKRWLKDHKISYLFFEAAKSEIEEKVEHTGVLGMKWGVRKTAGKVGGAIKAHIKKATTPSQDHLEYNQLRKKKFKNLTNDELGKVVSRMKLVAEYRRSGEFHTKQTKAMSNAELKTGINRGRLRKGLVRSRMGIFKFKDFVKTFKMSDSEVKALTRRMNLEKDFRDMKLEDYKNTKKLVDIFLSNNFQG